MESQAKELSYPREDKLLIRIARSEDICNIYDVLKQNEDAYHEIPPLKDLLRDFEASPPWFHALVATTDSGAVGVTVYHRGYWVRPAPAGRVLMLLALVVREGARRQGVGTELFREICRIALEEKSQIHWSHSPSNTAASAFFAQFRPDHSDVLDGTYVLRVSPQTVIEVADSSRKQPTDITIKLARPEDMAELNNMIREISEIRNTLHERHLDEKDLVTDGFTTPPWFFALLAWRHGAIVGMVVGHRPYSWAPSAYMQSLFVRPAARRCGLARRLVVEFCRMMAQEGITQVELNVHPENNEATSLYDQFRAERPAVSDHAPFRLETDKIAQILAQAKL